MLKQLVAASLALFATVTLALSANAEKSETDTATTTEINVLHSGDWTNLGYNAKGTWRIVEEDGQKFVELDDDFRTRSGPDLKLFLTPASVDSVTGRTATDGAVRVAELDSNRGAQRYAIDSDIDLSNYQSIIIHCERFSKLWVGSSLE